MWQLATVRSGAQSDQVETVPGNRVHNQPPETTDSNKTQNKPPETTKTKARCIEIMAFLQQTLVTSLICNASFMSAFIVNIPQAQFTTLIFLLALQPEVHVNACCNAIPNSFYMNFQSQPDANKHIVSQASLTHALESSFVNDSSWVQRLLACQDTLYKLIECIDSLIVSTAFNQFWEHWEIDGATLDLVGEATQVYMCVQIHASRLTEGANCLKNSYGGVPNIWFILFHISKSEQCVKEMHKPTHTHTCTCNLIGRYSLYQAEGHHHATTQQKCTQWTRYPL